MSAVLSKASSRSLARFPLCFKRAYVVHSRLKAKHEALKEEYATFARILHETEDSLTRVNVERTHCANELNEVQREIEAQHREKIRLEDEILEKIRAQLTADKAAKYSAKIVQRLRERTKDLEAQVCRPSRTKFLVMPQSVKLGDFGHRGCAVVICISVPHDFYFAPRGSKVLLSACLYIGCLSLCIMHVCLSARVSQKLRVQTS